MSASGVLEPVAELGLSHHLTDSFLIPELPVVGASQTGRRRPQAAVGGRLKWAHTQAGVPMEPNLETPTHLIPVLEELRQREPIFHHAELGATRGYFDKMMAPEFWEVGASGRRYGRDYALDSLVERYSVPHDDDWEANGFQCIEIAPDNYLLTYTLIQDGTRISRRSTIWRRTASGWRIVYHQGTLVESS